MRKIFVGYYDSFVMEVDDNLTIEEIVDLAESKCSGDGLCYVSDADTLKILWEE